MIETMNEQQFEFANKIQDYDPSHEIDLRFSSPVFDTYLCDDGASFPPLESRLEIVCDLSLTTQSLVVPSSPSILRDNTTFIMIFFDPTLPLTQSTKFEVGETFSIDASVDEDDTCYKVDNSFIERHDFNATLVGRSHTNVVVTVPSCLDLVDSISPDHLDAFHASTSCSLPYLPPWCYNISYADYHDKFKENVFDCVESLGTFRGYDPSLDPYSLYLGNIPGKILFTIAFNHYTDFSNACDKFRRALTIILRFMFKCTYSHPYELHA